MIRETDVDIARENRAIQMYVSLFNGSYKKLDKEDIDFKVFDSDGNIKSYVEVKGRIRTMRDSYPLPLSVFKLVRLTAKRLNPVVIWACEDGIIYAKAEELKGTIMMGGRPKREEDSYYDRELMAYYDKQKAFRYVRYN
jgi:hypothetical protein